MATMLAARLYEVRKMVLEEVPKPTAGPGEVVVKVKACGICQTDFCAYTGARMNWRKGMIVGHEMSGVIDEVGERVPGWAPGDDVIICPAFYCGLCDNCRSGFQHYCLHGGGIGGEGYENVWDGGFAEYVKVPALTLYRKPASIPFPTAAITEPLAGSYKGLILYSQMTVSEDVVIVGAGSMGLLLTQIARSAGAGNLICVDVVDYRLQKAIECGATHVINPLKEDAKKKIYEILPNGPDLVFEAAGAMQAADLTYELCRRGLAGAYPLHRDSYGCIVQHHAEGHAQVDPADGEGSRRSRQDHHAPHPAEEYPGCARRDGDTRSRESGS